LLFFYEIGLNNFFGLNFNMDKIFFYFYFLNKDFFGFVIILFFFLLLVLFLLNFLGDLENFIFVNFLVIFFYIKLE